MTVPPTGPPVIDGPCGLDVDTSCIDMEQWDAASEGDRETALQSAQQLLRSLTAGEAANCPVVLRPCGPQSCFDSASWAYDGVSWAPRLVEGGRWINSSSCGCARTCRHVSTPTTLLLPTSVAEVTEVWIDGAPLSPSQYRVQGRWLIRLDGDEWPQEQNMDLGWELHPDTFAVVYRPGRPLGAMGAKALGRLVAEFLKSCTTGKCALPSNMRTVSRQGITFDVEKDSLADGVTGIREVDYYTYTINPNRLKQPSRVYVPGRGA